MPGSSPPGRIHGLDAARALAITLAMLAHCCIHFGVWAALPDIPLTLFRGVTRAATPTFIILFGMMLELIYLRMIRRGDRRDCWTRLLARAIQCYLLYLCVVAAGLAGGKLSPAEAVEAALFLDNAYFANILKFYSLGLIAGIALLELRARRGLAAVALAAAAVWACTPAIKALGPLPEPFGHLASFLIGAGDHTGPAVLQGMTLAALGMGLGRGAAGVLSSRPEERAAGRRLLAGLAGLVLAAAAVLLAVLGPSEALRGFADFSFRAANHPGYYILGSAAALALIAGCCAVAAVVPRALLAKLSVFGSSSLFAYALGNVALNLLPVYHGDPATGLLLTAAFLAVLYVVTFYFQRLPRRTEEAAGPSAMQRLGRQQVRLNRSTRWLAGLCIDRLLPQAPRP